MGEVSIEDDVL